MSDSNALTVARAYHRAWSTRDLDKVSGPKHFTVEKRRIQRTRQIHDTAALRAAGFGRTS